LVPTCEHQGGCVLNQSILSPAGRWIYYRRLFYEGGVMNWKLELDALVERTIAFARDVERQSLPDLPAANGASEQALADTSKPTQLPAITPASERDEIRQRVSNFKAHQEKMAQQREDYYLQMKAKMLAPIDPGPALRPKMSPLA
jgi:hypothetical protein